jgi:tetratricopeptide (TPR) repeat protein
MWSFVKKSILSALVLAVAIATTGAATNPLGAQTAKEQIALGDREYAEHKAQSALDAYLKALSLEAKNYEALWKAARVETDLAELAPKGALQDSLMTAATSHAAAAIVVNPRDAEGHFCAARAAGRKALTLGTRDRIKYAKVVRLESLEALKADSLHPGALHVLGMWNAEIMRINGLARAFAKAFLGGDVFALASWNEAQRLLELAVKVDPTRIVHRLDLAGIYTDRGDKARAREQYEIIAKAPLHDAIDTLYKQQAAERLRKL